MSLNTRLETVEALAAERREFEHGAALAELNAWTETNWTEAEHDFWLRHLLNYPVTDEFFAHLSMPRAEAEAIIAKYPPLVPDEEAELEQALARVPADLAARLQEA